MTDACRGFSTVRPTQASVQSIKAAEREQLRRARGSDDGAGIHEESGLASDRASLTSLRRLCRTGSWVGNVEPLAAAEAERVKG